MTIEKALKQMLLKQALLDEFTGKIEITEAKEILAYWFRCAVSNDGGAHENEIELFLALSKILDSLGE